MLFECQSRSSVHSFRLYSSTLVDIDIEQHFSLIHSNPILTGATENGKYTLVWQWKQNANNSLEVCEMLDLSSDHAYRMVSVTQTVIVIGFLRV